MLQVSISITELDIIERALAIAVESGRMPNADVLGDDTRISALRQSLHALHDSYLLETWGSSRRRS